MLISPRVIFQTVRSLAVLAGCAYFATAVAYDPSPPKDDELPYLPAYCTARIKKTSMQDPEYVRWSQILGPDFLHIHHYCWGINFNRRATFAKNSQDRKEYYREAFSGYEYMVQHAAPSFVLMPEILVGKAKTLAKMGKPADAVKTFIQAIERKPDWDGGYVALSDFYRDSRNKPEAIAVAEQGFKIVPTSRSLARRISELTGRTVTPELPKQPSTPDETPKPADKDLVPEAAKP